jgi:lipopolysaccharide transport system ATP-binding protein
MDLGKRYRIHHEAPERYPTLRDAITARVRGAFGDAAGRTKMPPTDEEFWALKNVSFEVKRGEVVGVIGRNGAGKSTLLKLLSRIVEPTVGRIEIDGRVSSLLEVGTGFHPELTGRENIYLNGSILGMASVDVKRKFDEIVSFAEVERFLDTPVKRYSSGMYMRLAFAVAAHLETDIIIVDEVLAVGDAAFQKKCLGRMDDISASGRTVLLVSHNIGAVTSICQTGILLDAGSLVASGDIRAVVKKYYDLAQTTNSIISPQSFRGPLKGLSFDRIELNGRPLLSRNSVNPNEDLIVKVQGTSAIVLPNFRFAFSLFCEGVRLFTVHDQPEMVYEGKFEVAIRVPARLLRPGDYSIALGGRQVSNDNWIWGTDLAIISIIEEWGKDFDRDDLGLINLPNSAIRVAPRGSLLQGIDAVSVAKSDRA